MHASIRRYIVTADHELEAIQHAKTGWLPILERIPGFVAYYFIDTGEGEMIGVSIFKTPEGAAEANDLAGDYVHNEMHGMLKRTMLLEGEVVAGKWAG